MARRPDLAEVLLGRREAVQRSGLRRRSMANLTRAQRLALAPREPRGPALRYFRGLSRVLAEFRELVERELVPLLPEAVGQGQAGLVKEQERPLAPVEVRADVCPVCGPPPAWYGATVVFRHDALGDRFARRFGFLEVALSELLDEKRLGPVILDAAGAVVDHNRREMERVLRINLRDDRGLSPFIQDFLQTNVRLVRSVVFGQLQRMEEIVERATAGQTRVEALRDEIMNTFQVSKSRAALIARDQTLKANASLTQVRQQQAGVTEYIWTTSRDERVRGNPSGRWAKSDSNHYVLDGTRQQWAVPPITNPKTGARNHPGMDYQCRCTATPIVDHLLGGGAPAFSGGPRVEGAPPPPPPPLVAPPPPPPPADLLEDIVAEPSRSLRAFEGAYAGATPEEVDLIATGQMLPKNARVNVFPPIRLEVEANGRVHLTDGHHRLAAARQAGASKIRAIVRQYAPDGTYTERTVDLPIGKAGIRIPVVR